MLTINFANLQGMCKWYTKYTGNSYSCLGHLSCVEYLIQVGADVNIKSKEGFTCLYVASLKGHFAVVKHLISNGADVNAQNNNGR